MAFQLTIQPKSNPAEPEHFFAPGKLFTFSQTPVLIGSAQHCQCQLPDGAEECLQINSSDNGKQYTIESRANCRATLNQQELIGQRKLRSGDQLEVDNWKISFFLLYPRASHSWYSDVLGRLVKIGCALVLAMQFLLIFVLPEKLKDGNFWYGQQQRLAIIEKTDDLRRAIRGIDSPDPLVQALLEEYEQELQARTRYLRLQSERLTPRQRKVMLASLERITQDLEQLQATTLTPPPPALDLDRPVKKIIENIAYE